MGSEQQQQSAEMTARLHRSRARERVVPASLYEAAAFTDAEDVDTLRRVQWSAVDEAADDW